MKTKEVVFHPKQYEAYNFNTQYGAAIAGVQSGKTFVGAYWAATQILETPGDGLIAAPTYKILQQSTLPKLFKEFPQFRAFYKQQQGVLELPDKNIYIRSMDNPLGVEGMTISWAWLDEAGQMPLLAWTVVRSRTSTTRGRVFITTTPYNLGWLYQDFFIPWRDGTDKDLSVFSWASVESPYFPKDFYDKEKNRLRAEEFSRRYEGAFTRMEGLVYGVRNWHLLPRQEQRSDIVLGGIDWGYTNPAALVVIKVYDGRYYIVDEWYETGKTTPEIIEAAMSMQRKWGVNRWYADSANPEKIREAGTNTGLYVIPFEKQKDSITAGISQIQQYLAENKLYIFNDLENILSEFESYHYPEPEDGKLNKEEPEPMDNHLMDAMRYAITGFQPAKRTRAPIIEKTSFAQRVLSRRDVPRPAQSDSFE